ncbi:MAG: hypothetical protein D6737_03580, partial [Chloroflexi bacterium]
MDFESLWIDEWITWTFGKQKTLFDLVREAPNRAHPPGYYSWVWLWMRWIASDDVFLMRVSSVIPAILSVALVYRLGVEWFRSRVTGLAAAMFLGTMGIFVYYARELRMYTLVVLLVSVSWWLLRRYLDGHERTAWAYGASLALMAYTYYFTGVMAFVQFVFVVIWYRRRLRGLAKGYALAFVMVLPWLPQFVYQVNNLGKRHSRDGFFNALGKFGTTQPTTIRTLRDFINTYTAEQPAFVIIFIGLAIFLGYSLRNPRWYRRRLSAVSLWLMLTLLLFFGINIFRSFYNLRYVLMIVPSVALLIGVAVAKLPKPAHYGLVGVIGITGVLFHTEAFLPAKVPHNEIFQTIAAHYEPGDRIWYNFSLGALGSSIQYEVEYYLSHLSPHFEPDMFIWDAPNDVANVNETPRVWDVRPYWIDMPDEVQSVLTRDRFMTEEYIFGAYEVRLYEAPPMENPETIIGDLFGLRVDTLDDPVYRPGAVVPLETWWRAVAHPTLDYSYTLVLRDESNAVVARQDDGLAWLDGTP